MRFADLDVDSLGSGVPAAGVEEADDAVARGNQLPVADLQRESARDLLERVADRLATLVGLIREVRVEQLDVLVVVGEDDLDTVLVPRLDDLPVDVDVAGLGLDRGLLSRRSTPILRTSVRGRKFLVVLT